MLDGTSSKANISITTYATLKLVAILALFIHSPSAFTKEQLSIDKLVSMDLEALLDLEVSIGSKREQKIEEAPGTIVVIDKKEIRRYGAQNLRDILNRQTNLQVVGSNLYPDNRVTTRGVMQTHIDNNVLIMLNGRPVLGPIAGGIHVDLYRSFPV